MPVWLCLCVGTYTNVCVLVTAKASQLQMNRLTPFLLSRKLDYVELFHLSHLVYSLVIKLALVCMRSIQKMAVVSWQIDEEITPTPVLKGWE